MADLLLATNNRGKVREYQTMLAGLPFRLVTLEDCGLDSVEETGDTFEENARLKAIDAAQRSGLLSLADDSGLEVTALNGEPGVRSARYAGEDATDADRVRFLLGKLRDVSWEHRKARFRCVIALADPTGGVELFDGQCHGFITFEPHGELGFGYDPVFYFPEQNKTMAELDPEEKNRLSHRGEAARKAYRALEKLGR
jgi:XTP/dITP diphosphohydrolase